MQKRWASTIRCSQTSTREARFAAKYGVYLEDKGITGRAISIIDRDGKLAWHKNYDIPVVPDIKEVSQALANVK